MKNRLRGILKDRHLWIPKLKTLFIYISSTCCDINGADSFHNLWNYYVIFISHVGKKRVTGAGFARTRDVRLFPRFTRPSTKSGVDCDRGYFFAKFASRFGNSGVRLWVVADIAPFGGAFVSGLTDTMNRGCSLRKN